MILSAIFSRSQQLHDDDATNHVERVCHQGERMHGIACLLVSECRAARPGSAGLPVTSSIKKKMVSIAKRMEILVDLERPILMV
jgi:hypothetical protein